MLTLLFTIFTYGVSIPYLYFIGAIIISLEYTLDKLLITYYYKEKILHNDLLNRSVC